MAANVCSYWIVISAVYVFLTICNRAYLIAIAYYNPANIITRKIAVYEPNRSSNSKPSHTIKFHSQERTLLGWPLGTRVLPHKCQLPFGGLQAVNHALVCLNPLFPKLIGWEGGSTRIWGQPNNPFMT